MRRNENVQLMLMITLLFSASVFAGNWDDTQHAVVLYDSLYTIEVGGALFETNLSSGKKTRVNNATFAKTKFLFAASSDLVMIDTDGNLHLIEQSSGAWTTIGKPGNWKNTTVGAMIGDTLYTVEREGQMYETNTRNGSWRQIGKTDYLRTKFLYSGGSKLYTIENDGYFYSINPSSGASQKIGNSNDWLNTNRSVMFAGKLYSTEGGALYETDPSTGAWKKISKEYIRADHLFGSGSSLYYIEFNGELYRINLTDGSVVQIGK